MQISQVGIDLIKSSEGFSSIPYNDDGKTAWGYGHDQLPGETVPTDVTVQEAVDQLMKDLVLVQSKLSKLVPPTCTQNQWDALCDFGFNLGIAHLELMLSHGWSNVPVQMLRWCYEEKNGVMVVSPDLLARRQREAKLFNS